MSKVGINSVKVNGVRINGIGSPSHSSPSKPSLPPHIKDALVGVWCTEGKSNDDSGRDIIKNKISGRGGDFNILNAAYKLNSGYGTYTEDFNRWNNTTIKDAKLIKTSSKFYIEGSNVGWISYISSKYSVASTKVKISGVSPNIEILYDYSKGGLYYNLYIDNDGIYDIPNSEVGDGRGVGFRITKNEVPNSNYSITIEQIPGRQGAFVTDGVDDLIVSQKTVSEMLEGSDEVTVVSMVVPLSDVPSYCNFTAGNGQSGFNVRNTISPNSIGILSVIGYSATSRLETETRIINTIIGDKNALKVSDMFEKSNNPFYPVSWDKTCYKYAYYWTMMFKSASITIDDIHQVIAHFNLDKRVVPTIYYDIKKQGLSNDTPDKDWYLKDFSGNGRDAKLYNFTKKLNSGVGLYAADFNDWSHYGNVTSSSKLAVRPNYPGAWVAYKDNYYHDAYKVEINGLDDGKKVPYRYYDEGGVMSSVNLYNGENIIPKSFGSNRIGFGAIPGNSKEVTIEQIPEHDGALVSDGVIDYAQYVGDLGLKDYTIAVDRAYVEIGDRIGLAISDSNSNYAKSPFLFEYCLGAKNIAAFSYSSASNDVTEKFVPTRNISWQSKYSYNGKLLKSVGASNDLTGGNGLTIYKYSTFYAKTALSSLLAYDYSLSEFLLDRQLKRYKLGTLYPETK